MLISILVILPDEYLVQVSFTEEVVVETTLKFGTGAAASAGRLTPSNISTDVIAVRIDLIERMRKIGPFKAQCCAHNLDKCSLTNSFDNYLEYLIPRGNKRIQDGSYTDGCTNR